MAVLSLLNSPDRVEELRLSFGSVAEQYDRARPVYPQGMVEAVLDYGGLGAADRMLDIGVGTGHAAAAFAERGLKVVGIDPSAEMTAIANRTFRRRGLDALALTTDFESADVERHGFELVCAATAWHWLDEVTRFELAARALAPGGTLAVLWTWPHWRRTALCPVLDEVYRGENAFAHLVPLYPHDPDIALLAREWASDTRRSGAFCEPGGRICSWSASYTARQYTDLLGTYADHITLASEQRRRLFDAVERTINRCGGTIELPFTTLLLLARSAPGA